MDVVLNIISDSNESRQRSFDYQRTVNLYPETSKNSMALMSWPGKTLVSAALSTDRGLYNHNGEILQVAGTTLYSVNLSTGTRTSKGTIAGAGRCTFAGAVGELVIANGSGNVYYYNGSSVVEITDTDLEAPFFVAYLNNQWIYSNNKTTGRWVVSDAGDPQTVNGLNYATAESSGDHLYRPFVFRQQLFLFGARSIEPWWNTGIGSPPFDRQEGGILPKGLAADYSIASSDEAIYWLADDRRVYTTAGGSLAPISTDGLAYQFSQYTAVSDAVGSIVQIGNQDFYILQFPSQNVTWAYSQQKGAWIQLSSGTEYGRYDASCFIESGGTWYVSGFDGAIYKLDYTVYTENGSAFVRERITTSFQSEDFGTADKYLFWNSVKLRCTVGRGAADTSPFVMLQYSDDDGLTWSEEYWIDLGELGEYQIQPQIHGLGAAYRRKWRIRCTDNYDFNLYEMRADIEVGL